MQASTEACKYCCVQVQVADRYKKVRAGADSGGNAEQEDEGRFNWELRSRQVQGAGSNKVQEGTRCRKEQSRRNKEQEGTSAGKSRARRNKEQRGKRCRNEKTKAGP